MRQSDCAMTTKAGSKPKILFYLPGLYMGGAERHTLDLRQRLADLGYPTAVLVHDSWISSGMLDVAKADYVEILGLGGMAKLTQWPKVYAALERAQADVIVAINETMAIRSVLMRACGATNAKVVCTFHTTLMLPADEVRLPLFRLAARFLDALVFVSRNQASYWAKRKLATPQPTVVVNGVDLERFPDQGPNRAAAKQRLGLSPDDYVLGLLASFRQEKNHGQAVEALAQLKRDGVPAKLVFVGDGAMRAQVQRLVGERQLTDSVVFAGEQSDVRPTVAAFDVGLICSTKVETFSLAALELLASGIPMVMSNIGGASEIVEDGVNGLLFPSGDSEEFVRHLKTLADPATRRTFQAQARKSVERYSIDKMMQAYVALIEDLSGGHPAADTAGEPSVARP
jgi:glycosyltransferase involved in cell wall biosynthesis